MAERTQTPAPGPEPTPALDEGAAADLGARAARSLLREIGGWARAVRCARAEGLLPLVRCAVRLGRVNPPGDIAAFLLSGGRLRELAAKAVAWAARASSRALTDAGVGHAAIKGASIAALYGDRRLRPAGDVDLLVREEDLAPALEALQAIGYREAGRNPIEVVLAPPRGQVLGVGIDLHFRLAYPGQFFPDAGGMISRARDRDGIAALSVEDEVLVAALSAARDCFILTGRSVADIAVLARTGSPDWEVVVARAREWGLTGAAWAAFSCARASLGADVPTRAVDELRPSGPREAYLRAWLDLGRLSPYRLARRGGTLAARRSAMAALWPALCDGPGRRVRFVAGYALTKLRGRHVKTAP